MWIVRNPNGGLELTGWLRGGCWGSSSDRRQALQGGDRVSANFGGLQSPVGRMVSKRFLVRKMGLVWLKSWDIYRNTQSEST